MLNSSLNLSIDKSLYYDPKECFHLVIDWPSAEKDSEFQQLSELLDKVGATMSSIVASFFCMAPDCRMDDQVLEYMIVTDICNSAQAICDGIETRWSEALNDFIPVDPDDNYIYQNASIALFSGVNSPLNPWNLAQRIMPVLRFYYGHIHLPEDLEISGEWDVDINTFGDMAIIQFTLDENRKVFENLLIL